jgi:hypothetical protein
MTCGRSRTTLIPLTVNITLGSIIGAYRRKGDIVVTGKYIPSKRPERRSPNAV